jgi:hypothetical protein
VGLKSGPFWLVRLFMRKVASLEPLTYPLIIIKNQKKSMKTQSKKPAKASPSKGRTGTEKTSAPRTKKQEQQYEETDMEDDNDIQSVNPDPTKPDEETSYKKKHKIGFKTKTK